MRRTSGLVTDLEYHTEFWFNGAIAGIFCPAFCLLGWKSSKHWKIPYSDLISIWGEITNGLRQAEWCRNLRRSNSCEELLAQKHDGKCWEAGNLGTTCLGREIAISSSKGCFCCSSVRSPALWWGTEEWACIRVLPNEPIKDPRVRGPVPQRCGGFAGLAADLQKEIKHHCRGAEGDLFWKPYASSN